MNEDYKNALSEAELQSNEVNELVKSNEDSLEKDGDTEVKETIELEDVNIAGESKKSNKNPKLTILSLTCVVIVIAIVLILVMTKKNNKVEEQVRELPVSDGFELTDELRAIVDTLNNAMKSLYDSNAYITLHVGESEDSVVYYMYNGDKECYMESGYNNSMAVFRGDYKAVALTNPVETVEDLSLLALIERVIHLVEVGYATVDVEDTVAEYGAPTKSYNIAIKGIHNIRKIYSVVSDDYADFMLDGIFGEDYDKDKYATDYVDNTDTALKLQIVLGDSGEVGASARLYKDGFSQFIWWFDGYMELDGFKLESEWYEEDNTLEKWTDIAISLQDTISDSIDNYVEKELTEEEKEILNDNKEGTDVELPLINYVKPDGELTAEESEWWDYIVSIQNKILNKQPLTDEELSDYYAVEYKEHNIE